MDVIIKRADLMLFGQYLNLEQGQEMNDSIGLFDQKRRETTFNPQIFVHFCFVLLFDRRERYFICHF